MCGQRSIVIKMDFMLATHHDAESRYSLIRNQALQTVNEIMREEGSSLKLTLIDGEALNAFKAWKKAANRVKNWDWVLGYETYRFRYPKRFELALWYSNKLIGLSMGQPTYNGTAMRLDVVEAAPSELGDRPSIFETVLLSYSVYARLLNAREIRIMHPVNSAVRKYYEKFGYRYVSAGDYLQKVL